MRYSSVVRPSVTLVHLAKAVGRNAMPFGRDTRVTSSNILLDTGSRSPYGRGRFCGAETQSQFALRPAVMPPVVSNVFVPVNFVFCFSFY